MADGRGLEPPEVAVVHLAVAAHLGELAQAAQAFAAALFAPKAALVGEQVRRAVFVHVARAQVGTRPRAQLLQAPHRAPLLRAHGFVHRGFAECLSARDLIPLPP